MDIRACYDAMGADYEEVFGRFHSEKLIIKFAGKFLDDPSYASLCSTLASNASPSPHFTIFPMDICFFIMKVSFSHKFNNDSEPPA